MRLLYNQIFTLKINFILKLNSRKSETIFDCRIFVALANSVTIAYAVVTFSVYDNSHSYVGNFVVMVRYNVMKR